MEPMAWPKRPCFSMLARARSCSALACSKSSGVTSCFRKSSTRGRRSVWCWLNPLMLITTPSSPDTDSRVPPPGLIAQAGLLLAPQLQQHALQGRLFQGGGEMRGLQAGHEDGPGLLPDGRLAVPHATGPALSASLRGTVLACGRGRGRNRRAGRGSGPAGAGPCRRQGRPSGPCPPVTGRTL
jgi:hypothetical protein